MYSGKTFHSSVLPMELLNFHFIESNTSKEFKRLQLSQDRTKQNMTEALLYKIRRLCETWSYLVFIILLCYTVKKTERSNTQYVDDGSI